MLIKMDLFFTRLLVSGIFITIFGQDALAQCVKSTPCICNRENGKYYDLTTLKQPYEKILDVNHTLRFQPCENVNLTFKVSKSNESQCNSSSICLLNSEKQSINLGAVEDSVWKLTKDSSEIYLVFHHTNPNTKESYETKIILFCCEECETTALNVISFNSTKYNLLLASPYICKYKAKPRELSTGSVLVILLFVFSAVYLLSGALALRIFRGAIGLELIPNYEFWSNLPGLVRDGVTFTLSGCTVLSYEQI